MRARKLWELAETKGSRLIVALDSVPVEPGKLIEEVEEFAVGVKVGLPFLMLWGPRAVRELCEAFSGELYMLCDFKLADIPDVVAEELKLIKELGFDGAILHLFQGGVKAAAAAAGGLDLFGVAAMTHPGSRLIDAHFDELVREALEAGLGGLVVPATKPELVRSARRTAPGATLLAPGVGAQGALPGSALEAGADFEIVGRLITASPDPRSAAEAVRSAHRARLGAAGKWR